MHHRWKAMQYRQKTHPEPQYIGHPETVYFLQLLLQGEPKTVENRGKNCQKYAAKTKKMPTKVILIPAFLPVITFIHPIWVLTGHIILINKIFNVKILLPRSWAKTTTSNVTRWQITLPVTKSSYINLVLFFLVFLSSNGHYNVVRYVQRL